MFGGLFHRSRYTLRMIAGKAVRSTGFILLGIALGIVTGLLLGKQATPLGSVGKYYVELIKAIAAPLLFFAIVDAIITSDIKWKSASRFIKVVLVNTTLATVIGITIANVFQPGKHLQLEQKITDTGLLAQAKDHKVDFLGFIDNLIPNTIVEPFVQSNILGVVFLAVIVGVCLRSFQRDEESWTTDWAKFIHGGYRLSERIITWLVALTPVAVFGVIAKSVGENGFKYFVGLSAYLVFALLGLAIQTFVVYPIWLLLTRRVTLKEFWKAALEPVINAFGINSSLASLPLTLKALDKLGVSKESSRMAACIGTNLNNDGILLYEAFAVMIVAQAMGIELSISSQISIAFLCVLTALGIAGVPEAGIISLAVILGTLGISAEILPILLTVDWIIARMRSVTNVVADMTTSIVIDKPDRIATIQT